jgi:hypothetical protein
LRALTDEWSGVALFRATDLEHVQDTPEVDEKLAVTMNHFRESVFALAQRSEEKK